MKTVLLAAVLMIFAGVLSPSASYADAALFTSSGCNKCHAISAAKVESKASGEEEGAPDLSHVGKNHDAAFITSFLKKEAVETAHEGVTAGKKHPIKFKGTDEELGKLANWLAGMK